MVHWNGETTEHKQWCAHTTKMPKMTRLDTATYPHDPHLAYPYTCHDDNKRRQHDTPHPTSCKNEQFLDMFLKRSKNVSWAHSGFNRVAHRFTQPRFAHLWRTPIPMFLCMTEPRDARHPPAPTLPLGRLDLGNSSSQPEKWKNKKSKNETKRKFPPITDLISTKLSTDL